ncbi:MAG: ABC transporter substrate-binding protein [Ruminococcaceae bacterium]|nr:ABC transporter substrate-binding protein [Oscillospiraceae bacterium]
MRRILVFALSIVMLLSAFVVSASAAENDGINRKYEGTTIIVFNWGEYIADGSDGSMDVVKEFEKETGIHVEYMTYANNEELYAALNNGGTTYDVVVPSDYMFERLYYEDLLQPIDYNNIPYYSNIASKFKGVFKEGMNNYYVPYTIGMVGVIYNTTMIEEVPGNWDLLWDEKYAKQVLMFDNPRDAFAIAQFKLGLSINSENLDDWSLAADALEAQKSIVKRYVNDEVFDIMEDGLAAAAPYYAGDYFTMKDENDDLEFYYPRNEEGELITNQFIDVMCIPKASKNKEAAEMFINYILRDDIALEVAEYICYASPNVTVVNNPEYSFSKEQDEYAYNILYPEELAPDSEKSFDNRLVFSHLDRETLNYMNARWSSVKAQVDASGVYITCAVILSGLLVLVVWKLRKKQTRRIDEEYYMLSQKSTH